MAEFLGTLVAITWVGALVWVLLGAAARHPRGPGRGIVAGGLPWWHVGGQPAGSGQPVGARNEHRR